MKVLLEYLGIKEAGPVITIGMAKGFIDNGIDVYAILSSEIENKEEWKKILKSKHLFFIETTPKKRKIVTSSISFICDCIKIKQTFDKIRFDYVIKTFLVLGGWDSIVCKFIKSNRDFTIVHDPIPHSSMPIKDAQKYKKLICKSKEIIVLTKKFITVIEDEYNIPNNRIHYMKLGQMSFANSKEALINEKNDNDSCPVRFLFFGRIDGYKGIDVLLYAYKKIADDFPSKTQLVIAGNGDVTPYKETIAKISHVELVNRYIDDNEIPGLFLKPKTILVLPYKDATQSGVTPLAFQFLTPVIASDIGGLKEQLFDGNVGCFFEANNKDQLYEIMKKFVVNIDVYYGEQVKMKQYAKKLSWSEVVADLMNEINS